MALVIPVRCGGQLHDVRLESGLFRFPHHTDTGVSLSVLTTAPPDCVATVLQFREGRHPPRGNGLRTPPVLRHLVKALLLIVQEALYSTATASHYHNAFVYFDPTDGMARLAIGATPHHPVAIWSPASASNTSREWALSQHAVRAYSLIYNDRPNRCWSYSSHGTSWSCNLCHVTFESQDAPAHVAIHTHQQRAAAAATQLVKELNQSKLRLTVPREATP